MELAIEIFLIVLPILIVGGISLFVIKKLQAKQKQGTLGRKKTQEAQILLDSSIPLGMLVGSMTGLVFSMIFPIPMGTAIALGAGAGLLGGYFVYVAYSKKEDREL